MIEKIKEEDLLFYQTISHPIACAEILFHDFDTLGAWDINRFGKVRLYQYPMMAYDSLFLYDPKLSPDENRKIKNNLAESYNLGGRLTGKTRISILIDGIVSIFNKVFKWAVMSSYDKLHVLEIFEKLINAFENHPVLKFFNAHSLRSPTYKMNFDNGCLLESVNMNITGKNPGGQFYGKHIDRHWMEESSMLTKDVSSKMLMAQSEQGCIKRYSGMTDFTKESPIGQIFFDLKNKSKIVNLPAYANPTWNKEKEEEAILEFGGLDSPGYQVQIEGKVIQGVSSVFDILKIRDTYIKDKNGEAITIKSFEIKKDSFFRYKEILGEGKLEKPNNAESFGFYFDVGEGGAPSEYIFIAKLPKYYKYVYRLTTFELTPEEEKELVDYLIELLEPNTIGLDHSSGVGKALYSHLISKHPEGNIIPVDFYGNIEIDFAKDKSGEFILDKDGKPTMVKADVVDWSIQCLKSIFYKKEIQCFEDVKLDAQFNNVISARTDKGKVLFKSKGANHLFQAFQVFAISYWLKNGLQNSEPIKKHKPGMGVIG